MSSYGLASDVFVEKKELLTFLHSKEGLFVTLCGKRLPDKPRELKEFTAAS
jgi:hypothetical protein